MLKYIAAPLIGALIGYCTNYIAVKMLFRPRHEKYFFGHKVPLTLELFRRERLGLQSPSEM